MLTTQYYELKLIVMWAYDTVINSSEVEYKRQNKIRRKKHETQEQKEYKEKDEASFRVEEKKWKRRIKMIKRYKALSHLKYFLIDAQK